jgi:hypothetical protein
MAESAGKDLFTLNMFIGGCSLETHAYNIFFNKPYYRMEYNGIDDPALCREDSIQNGLTEKEWDFITIQQVSRLSGKYETFQPHLNRVISRVRDVCPNAKILIHKTWAYDDYPFGWSLEHYDNSRHVMHESLTEAYKQAAADINADGIIPTGDVIKRLREYPIFDLQKEGAISLTRDGGHLSFSYGRYAAAATWYQYFYGDIENVSFLPAEEDMDPKLIRLIKETVCEICK